MYSRWSSLCRWVGVLLALTLFVAGAWSRGRGSYGTHSHSKTKASHASHKVYGGSRKPKCVGCTRDSKGRIKRSARATRSFQKSHPCPSTGRTTGGCPGYVIDHIRPLHKGGADSPANMQWQTVEAAKAKDRVE